MRSQSITLIAALLGAATAVPCYEFTMSEGSGRTYFEGLSPFVNQPTPEGHTWDIVPAEDCWARWQVIRPGQQPNDARVTKTVFDSTPDSVRATIDNYFNSHGTNDQLWLPMNTRSLQYSHMLPGTLEGEDVSIDAQGSLSRSAKVVVSIILPSGKSKLRTVLASRTGDNQADDNVERAEGVGITGLAGTIASGDWAYMRADELKLNMSAMLREQKTAFYARRPWNKKGFAYALAEKANGDCVVIDFRNWQEFVLRENSVSA